MAAQVVRLPIDNGLAQLGAAGYLALLAYPDYSETPRRDAFIRAVKALFLKRWIRRGGDRTRIRPELRGMPNQQINNRLQATFDRIMVRRLPAARVFRELVNAEAAPLLARAFLIVLARSGPLSPTIKVSVPKRGFATARQRVELSLSRLHVSYQGENFRRIIWRQTRPVLHLAISLQETLAERRKANPRTELIDLIYDPAWVERAVDRAETLRDLFAKMAQVHPSLRGTLNALAIRESESIQVLANDP